MIIGEGENATELELAAGRWHNTLWRQKSKHKMGKMMR